MALKLPIQDTDPVPSSLTEETRPDEHRRLSNLPCTVPHFVNREQECRDILRHLAADDACRCVILHGPIGMGKSTTAIKVGNDLLHARDHTIVLYVNCRFVTTLDDFAWKILTQLTIQPTETPIAEVKRRLRYVADNSRKVLLIDNFELFLDAEKNRRSEPQMKSLNPQPHSDEEETILQFITDLATQCTSVKILITSTELVLLPEVGPQTIELVPFKKNEALLLLRQVYKEPIRDESIVEKLIEVCDGLPLLLYSVAYLQPDLADVISVSRPEDRLVMWSAHLEGVSPHNKINESLKARFDRLDHSLQKTLVRLTVFKGFFTMCRAVDVFSSFTQTDIMALVNHSLVQKTKCGTDCVYSMLSVTRDYCLTRALIDETRFAEGYFHAREKYVDHYCKFLEENFKIFLSTNSSSSIAAFREEEENVMQLLEWCGEDGTMDAEQRRSCIDVMNAVGELLAKMIGRNKFVSVFSKLKSKCEEMQDQRRLSECLTSLGIKEVFSCSCSPGLCQEASRQAKEYLQQADEIQRDSLDGVSDNSRAQCLAKLGRCLTQERFDEGEQKIREALLIRATDGEDGKVMLAATYNDLAVAQTLNGNHKEAMQTRVTSTLPVYREVLGDHPFTATILNNLSNNCFALGEYDDAIVYSTEALQMRETLLGDHQDTAKSLYDLGLALKGKGRLKEALSKLEAAVAMQEKALDNREEELRRSRSELADVRGRLSRE